MGRKGAPAKILVDKRFRFIQSRELMYARRDFLSEEMCLHAEMYVTQQTKHLLLHIFH